MREDLAGSRQSLRVVPPASFGSRLRDQRRADDLTQAALGKRFGVRQQTIGAWEHGERPQNRFLGDLANYLGMGKQELLSLIDNQPELPTGQDAVAVAEDEPADSDAATMRLLARRFVEDQERGSLPPAAADIYRNLTEYFRDRAVGR